MDLAACYEMYARRVWAYARALSPDRGFAEDWTAEAFLALAARCRSQGAPEDPLGFLLSAVRSRVVDEARRRRSARRWGGRPPRGIPPPDRQLLDRERRERVFAAVRKLEPALGEIVALRQFAGLTLKECSRLLKVPVSTLDSRYGAALERLRDLLKEDLA
jgi:RNA polymerase sigma-70 factor (ECF subfamily)